MLKAVKLCAAVLLLASWTHGGGGGGGNSAPSFSAGPTIVGSIIQGSLLTVTYTPAGVPAPTPSFQWKAGGTNVGTNVNTYTTGAPDLGKTVTSTVTLNNGIGSPAVATSPAVGPIIAPGSASLSFNSPVNSMYVGVIQ